MNAKDIFFTSDTHFGHRAMLNPKIGNRPFQSVDEMDEALINNWNQAVGPNQHIFHLGDVSFRNSGLTMGILGQLNGNKYLVNGNHDSGLSKYCKDHFKWVKPYFELKVTHEGTKHRAVLCHFAFRSWNMMHHGAYNFHGHSHGNLKAQGKQVDVGVDNWDMKPVSLLYLIDLMKMKPIYSEDHHQPKGE